MPAAEQDTAAYAEAVRVRDEHVRLQAIVGRQAELALSFPA